MGTAKPIEELTLRQRHMLQQNVRLAYKCAIDLQPAYTGRLERDDAIGVAFLTLARCVALFDPDHGTAFSTYACFSMRQQILRAARMNRLIHVPEAHDPALYPCPQSLTATRYDQPTDPPDTSDPVPEQAHQHLLADRLDELLKHLDPRARAIVRARYIEEMDLQRIGERFGISKERVRQCLLLAMKRLRECRYLVSREGAEAV